MTGLQRVPLTTDVAGNSSGNGMVLCPAGKRVLSGGYSLPKDIRVQAEYPLESGTGMYFLVDNTAGYAQTVMFFAWCATAA